MGPDAGQLYAMKVLKKASLKGNVCLFLSRISNKFLAGMLCSLCRISLSRRRAFLFCLHSQGQSSH